MTKRVTKTHLQSILNHSVHSEVPCSSNKFLVINSFLEAKYILLALIKYLVFCQNLHCEGFVFVLIFRCYFFTIFYVNLVSFLKNCNKKKQCQRYGWSKKWFSKQFQFAALLFKHRVSLANFSKLGLY